MLPTTKTKWARAKDEELIPLLAKIVANERARWEEIGKETSAIDDYDHFYWDILTDLSQDQQRLCKRAANIIDGDNPISHMAEFSENLIQMKKKREWPTCRALLFVSSQVSHISVVIPIALGLDCAVGVSPVAEKVWQGDPIEWTFVSTWKSTQYTPRGGTDGRFKRIASIDKVVGSEQRETAVSEDEVRQVLLDMVEHPDPEVRLATIEAMKFIQGGASSEPLFRAAFDEIERVSCEALRQIVYAIPGGGGCSHPLQLFGSLHPLAAPQAQRLMTLCLDALSSDITEFRSSAIEVLHRLSSGEHSVVFPASSSQLAKLRSAYDAEVDVWIRRRISEVIRNCEPSATEYWSEVFHRRLLDASHFPWELRKHLKELESAANRQARFFVQQHLEALWWGDPSPHVRRNAKQLLDEMGVKPGTRLQRAIRTVRP